MCLLVLICHLQVVLGKGLGKGGVSVQGLLKENYEAIFLGIGLPDPKVDPIFKNLPPNSGFFTSKDFLPVVSMASKAGVLIIFHVILVT